MKVLVTGRLPDEILALLGKEHDLELNREDRPMEREKILEKVRDKEGLLCMITDTVDRTLLQRAPRLKMIANMGVGYDNIDLNAASSHGIPVSNTPGVLTEATADLAFSLILAVARRIVEGDRRTRMGEFRFWAPLHFLGREVSGKTLGIVGLGRIGKAVARRAKGFDMKVLYHNRKPLDEKEERALGVEYRTFRELFSQADFISLHVPLSEKTRHLVNREALGWMRPDAYLINTSRGAVVDEGALVEFLKERRIGGAGLDVYENEPRLTPGLAELDNVVLLPHLGSATLETRTRMARLAAENLLAGLRGERPPNCLNWEELGRAKSRA
ncbi:MAG: D-glycerate dehydrogenase [Deltaproteobacteria bacterium]|nr:D-glycerate dehydrogenase [Deltaproteobacteria bacterium]MBW2017244.1 D-glycerate dehydrogenase [Deltaproteobacteria bacterium]MBW2129680.1 D-glycerate dehydrogenase [Deltaproteobacteria bacterium]MBW2304768.1 D-glycerate dehydrogenase [Deltaproteobacteria bacterium]